MDMRKIEEGREMLCREYEDLVKRGGFSSSSDLDKMYKVIVAIEKLYKIEELDGGNHSQAEGWNSYGNGNSYRGMSNNGYSGRRYSRADGMVAEEINRMMNEGNMNTDERETLRKALMIMGR